MTVTLSGVGVWSAGLRAKAASEVAEAAAELEELGYTSLWIPDFNGGIFHPVERLLSATGRITVATGILNLWMYTPQQVAEEHHRIEAAYGGRFLMGIGVSHAETVESVIEDARYENPLGAMGAFLDQLDAAPTPVPTDSRVLAALGPKMLAVAAERAGGAHPYNVTPEHTAMARRVLGDTKLLVPEQAVALTKDRDEARQLGREFFQHYLERRNYTNNLRRLGFGDDDLAHGGSDRLIDALVAWGDPDAIAARIQEHRNAGADSVCIQVVGAGGMVDLPLQAWRQLAPALTAA
jgi:probable F420-dependent oxidoreductase